MHVKCYFFDKNHIFGPLNQDQFQCMLNGLGHPVTQKSINIHLEFNNLIKNVTDPHRNKIILTVILQTAIELLI